MAKYQAQMMVYSVFLGRTEVAKFVQFKDALRYARWRSQEPGMLSLLSGETVVAQFWQGMPTTEFEHLTMVA